MYVFIRLIIESKGRGLIIHTFFNLFHNPDLELTGNRVISRPSIDVIKKQVYNINTCWLEMVNNRLPIHVTNYIRHQLLVMITQYLKLSPIEVNTRNSTNDMFKYVIYEVE